MSSSISKPTRSSILLLYRQLLRNSNLFKDYNFRLFSIRRTKELFTGNRQLTDTAAITDAYQSGLSQLELIKRQVLINNLYYHGEHIVEQKQRLKLIEQKRLLDQQGQQQSKSSNTATTTVAVPHQQ